MKQVLLSVVLTVLAVLCAACEREPFYAGYAVQNVEAVNLYVPKAVNTKWDDGTVKIAKVTALYLNFNAPQETQGVEISSDTGDTYFVLPMLDGEQIGKYTLPARKIEGGGLDVQRIMWAGGEGTLTFDQLVIIPADGDGSYSVGHVSLIGYVNRIPDLSGLRRIDGDWALLSAVKAAKTVWNQDGNTVIEQGSYVYTRFDSPQTAQRIELSLDCNDTYDVVLFSDGEPFAVYSVPVNMPSNFSGLNINTVVLRYEDSSRGFDAVAVIPTGGDGNYSLGHVKLK